jgi:23S rRNA (guanosine2251-2'-O)-methyltransferase
MREELVYGVHAVDALLKNPHRTTKCLYVSEEREDARLQNILKIALEKAIPIEKMSIPNMNKRFKDCVHQGIVASTFALPDYTEHDIDRLLEKSTSPILVLILDGVTDPHNLGACLRTADAVGVDFVIIPKDKSASITPVVSKVASGAAESVPLVRVTNLVRAMEHLKEAGVWIYGADGEAPTTLYKTQCSGNLAIAMGAEGEGLRRLTKEHCDALFSLPMQGSVDSLNVSVATGVSLYEVRRQQQGGK